eukprot:TRINITY_DN37095_c0_g1_i1.p1 TRINITY_DN37095_c0_g1~~TRINITY_DN37095_c0_g1_i1.p1  ORF type:complete len:476 (+),score=67.99 TRINITY_DN37095_c0_g1_i1:112-1539(+)
MLGDVRRVATEALRRHAFVVAAPGLERRLEHELQSLRVPGRFDTVPGGVIVSGAADESIWRTVLQSRVAESVRLRLGDPFFAPDVRTLDAGLEALPWEDYLLPCHQRGGGKQLEMPIIRASSSKSRLFHTRLIEERVASAVQGCRPTRARSEIDETPPHDPEEPPSVYVNLKHDECQVNIAASGSLHRRGYRVAGGEAPLRETIAAACVLATPLLRRLSAAAQAKEELVLWDPFCGSGVLLLEALAIVMGRPPGIGRGPSIATNHKFNRFPSFDEAAFLKFSNSLKPDPHPGISCVTILGSDISSQQIDASRRNLRRLTRRLHGDGRFSNGDGCEDTKRETLSAGDQEAAEVPLPCKVDFMEGPPARISKLMSGKPTMIMTNVPYGILSGASDSRSDAGSLRQQPGAADAYAQLGRILRQNRADWRGVYCIVETDPDSFASHTGLNWKREERFLNGGRWVDLLQWSSESPRRRRS